MPSYNNSGPLIWTNHALERLHDRKIPQHEAELTFSHPDNVYSGKQAGSTEYVKSFGDYRITVIGKKNDKNEWIAVSIWRDPPMFGTKDHQRKEAWHAYKNAGFWGKVWLTLRKQVIGF